MSNLSRAILCTAAIATTLSAQAHAYEARINLSGYVPTRCQMEFIPSVTVTGDRASLGTVNQYCNTRFQLRFNHAPLAADAVLGFGDAMANANGSSTLVEPNGKPTISATNLWLSSSAEQDAMTFVNSVVIEITPLAF